MAREKNINYSRSNDLTIEEIKACKTFRHYTDEQAKTVIETLKLFTKIAYDVYKKDHENL